MTVGVTATAVEVQPRVQPVPQAQPEPVVVIVASRHMWNRGPDLGLRVIGIRHVKMC